MTVFAFYLYGADHQFFFLDKNVFDIQGVHEIVFPKISKSILVSVFTPDRCLSGQISQQQIGRVRKSPLLSRKKHNI